MRILGGKRISALFCAFLLVFFNSCSEFVNVLSTENVRDFKSSAYLSENCIFILLFRKGFHLYGGCSK